MFIFVGCQRKPGIEKMGLLSCPNGCDMLWTFQQMTAVPYRQQFYLLYVPLTTFIYFMFPWPAGDPFAKKTMECKLNFQACYVPKTKCHAKCKMNNHHWIHSYLVPCPSANEICVHHYFFLVKTTKTNRPPIHHLGCQALAAKDLDTLPENHEASTNHRGLDTW